VPYSEPIDDFDDLPTRELGQGLELTPSAEDEKSARLRSMVAAASPKAIGLGKGKQIMSLVDAGETPQAIAKQTGLTVREVESVAQPYAQMSGSDKAEVQRFEALEKNSVFNLMIRLQEQFTDLIADMKFIDDPELKIGYYAERRQLYKLAKDILQDVTFKEQQEREREEELQIVLKFIDRLDPKMANELYKDCLKRTSTTAHSCATSWPVDLPGRLRS
jgi:hypothetical protein